MKSTTFYLTRILKYTGRRLFVEERWRDDASGPEFFVADAENDDPPRTHCGPYATREQAEDWINAIRETNG